MSALNQPRPALRRNRMRTLVVLGSLAAHGIILGGFAVQRGMDMSRPPPAPQPLYIRIEPRPPLLGEIVREPPLTVIEEPREQPSRQAEADLTTDEEDEIMLPLRQVAPSAAQQARAQGVDPVWQVRPEESLGDRVARALSGGALNCSPSNTRLTQAQREACEEQLARGARDAAPIQGTADPERDTAFRRQGAANIARYEAQRAPLAGGTGVVGPADCVGSNLGMGCAGAHLGDVPGVDMRQGGSANIRQRGDRVDPDR